MTIVSAFTQNKGINYSKQCLFNSSLVGILIIATTLNDARTSIEVDRINTIGITLEAAKIKQAAIAQMQRYIVDTANASTPG